MPRSLSRAVVILTGVLFAALLFAVDHRASENKFSQPKTVIHVVSIQWNSDASESDKKKVMDGVTAMAAAIPGIKNVWLASVRIQPNDFNAAFAIEFQNRAAADAYSESLAHKMWAEQYLRLRARSVSIQVSNR
jgi:hypothetical protein